MQTLTERLTSAAGFCTLKRKWDVTGVISAQLGNVLIIECKDKQGEVNLETSNSWFLVVVEVKN